MNRKITKHLVLVGFLGVVLGLHWSGGEVQQFKHSVQKILQAEAIMVLSYHSANTGLL